MTKIVYNACYGGFSLSHEAVMRYAEIKGMTLHPNKGAFGYDYYLCPPEEFERIYAEEKVKPVSPSRFIRSNELYFCERDIERTDPVLVQVVEELGDAANGSHAKLRIVELPAGTLYMIDEYDGFESVTTQDGYDWKVA
jgi:hypothetical protein